jgi:3-isopropylmalate/(R)-2-methylmalate dehydratase small subunit
MAAFDSFRSRIVPLPRSDIDTDQIIPARFLKVTEKSGLGRHLFADWRYRADGAEEPSFALARPEARGAQVLLAGDNFGCGSSREHAPWALCDWGFRAVIAPSFADIFRGNALKNGLLPVAVTAAVCAEILARVTADAAAQVTIDLDSQVVVLPDGRAVGFPIDPFARRCLLDGTDELGYLLGYADAILAYEARTENRPPPPNPPPEGRVRERERARARARARAREG